MSSSQTFWGVESAPQQLAHQVVHALPVTVASVALWDRPSFSLTVKGASGLRTLTEPGIGSRILLALAPWHRRTLEEGKPLLLDLSEPVDGVSLPLATSLKWAYLVPLHIDDEQIGVLGLGEARSTDREPLTAEKQARCQAIVDEFQATLGQFWQVSRLRRQIRATSPVLRMAGRMVQARTYQELLACCASEVSDWLGAPVRAVLLRTGAGRGMDVVATWNLPPLEREDSRQLLMALTREGGVWQGPVRITRVSDDPLDPLASMCEPGASWSRVAMPLIGRARVQGMVCLYVEDDLQPTEWDLELFRHRAEIVSVGVEVVAALEEQRHEVEGLSRAAWDLLSSHPQAVLHQALAGIMELTSTRLSDRPERTIDGQQGDDVPASARRGGGAATRELTALLRELQETGDGNCSPAAPLEVNGLVRRALSIGRAAWDDAPRRRGVNLELTFEPHHEPLLVSTSAALIGAIICTIENAVEALPEGGRIVVRTARDNGHAVIAVADSGPGIPEAHRDRVFSPFFSTKGKSHLGLGLSVVRALVSRFGGETKLVTGENGGTTVLLRLPIVTASA